MRADRAQMVQMLSNLARTAAEAMPAAAHSRSRATPASWMRTCGARGRGSHGTLRAAQFSDSGSGIEEDSLPHVFEPFFAPDASRGDGLDLPSVYGVVKQSGGFIWIDSDIGEGTHITVLLPPLGVEEVQAADADPTAIAPHVLLVEDEEEVRELLIDVLSSHGLRVTPVGVGRGGARRRIAASVRSAADRRRPAGRERSRPRARGAPAIAAPARAVHLGAERRHLRGRGSTRLAARIPAEAIQLARARREPARAVEAATGVRTEVGLQSTVFGGLRLRRPKTSWARRP